MKHRVVGQVEWYSAQKALNAMELELDRKTAEVAAARRELPWLKVTKDYLFIGTDGVVRLSELFQGKNQLILQHFMFTPDWNEGCRGCSLQADSVDGARPHFEAKDVAFVAVSRAPIAKLEAFRQRMGWKFTWVSSEGSDFNFDLQVSFTAAEIKAERGFRNYQWQKVDMEDLPGQSVFYKNEAGEIFRTYSNYSGDDRLLPTLGYLDITPIGRNEKSPLDWIKHHDKY